MWAMQHPIWPGEDQRHLPDSKPVPSSPVISAHVCSQNSRAQPSLVLAGSEQREGPFKHHKWCSQSLVVVVLRKGSALLLWYSRSRDQVRDYPKCSAQLARRGTCWKWSEYSFYYLKRNCIDAFYFFSSWEQAGTSICTTRFYTSSDPKPAARASPHLCPTSEKQAPRGRV